jgi:hypothetical protein
MTSLLLAGCAPGAAGVIDGGPAGEFLALCGLFFGIGAVLCEKAHVVFGEGHRSLRIADHMFFEQTAAQQRKLLHGDLVLADKLKVSADDELSSRSIRRYALKSIMPHVGVLMKTGQNELHLFLLSKFISDLPEALEVDF